MCKLVGPLKAKGHCSKCILCRYHWNTDSSHCTYDLHDIEKADTQPKATDYGCPFLYMESTKQLQMHIRYFINKIEGETEDGKSSSNRGISINNTD